MQPIHRLNTLRAFNKLLPIFHKVAETPWILGTLFIGYGLFLCYHDTFLASFYYLPGGCDGRLNHYFLEHSWLWMSGNPLHQDFWNAPFFYPVKNVMAYSDILLGTAPIYWIFRCMGLSPTTAFLLWPAALAVLNWISMYIMLRSVFRTDALSAGTGAFLFGFCAPRLYKLVHLQLWPQFYTILFIYFIVIFYNKRNSNTLHSHLALLLAASCAALQFYAGFYLGWFLFFGTCMYCIILLCRHKTRVLVLPIVRQEWKWIIICVSVFLLLVSPMLVHYMDIKAQTGLRPWEEVKALLPGIRSWVATPSFIYEDLAFIAKRSGEQWLGIGIITLLISLYGLIKYGIENIWVRALLITTIVIVCLSICFMGKFSFWRFIYLTVPGASALRAVARIFFLILIALCIGYALAMTSQKRWVQILLLLTALIENANWGVMANTASQYEVAYAISKEAIKSPLPFLYITNQKSGTFDKNLDAMWASIYANRPTFNGYSGNFPSMEQYEIADTPADEIPFSTYLSKIRGPYFLIINESGEIRSKTVNTP